MLYVKAFHIIFMVTWFASLFYLPRLFVYHAETIDALGKERFNTMQRRLYYGIAWPGGLLTTILGIVLITYNPRYYLHAHWLHAKVGLVILLWIYHVWCGRFTRLFACGQNSHSALFYRWWNEVPTILLLGIVLLVVVKPS